MKKFHFKRVFNNTHIHTHTLFTITMLINDNNKKISREKQIENVKHLCYLCSYDRKILAPYSPSQETTKTTL